MKAEFTRSKFYTLLAIAYAVAKDLRQGTEQVEYYLHLAIDGYREFNFDHSTEVKAVEVEMKPWKQIDWPGDMVDWVRVAFKCGNFLKILTQDSYIPKTHDKVGCTPQENKACPSIDLATSEDLVSFTVWDGFLGYGKYYGQNLNYNYLGYFDVNNSERVINFKETAVGFDKVYLEYVSDGLDAGAMTVVNPYAYKLLKDYVKWQRKENDDRFSEAEKDRAERQYNKSVKKFRDRVVHMDPEDIKEALRSGWTMVVQN